MLNNLLDVEPTYVSVGEAAIDGLIGFMVVFFGISILIGVVWLVGYFFRKSENRKSSVPLKSESKEENPASSVAVALSGEDDEDELAAVIAAAVAVATESEKGSGCGFIVKKIKRIS